MTAPTRIIGSVDPNYFSTTQVYDVLEHIPDLQPGPLATAAYARMRRESRLAAILAGYCLQIRRASWQVEPAGCRPEVVQQVADDLGLPIAGQDTPTAARTSGVSWNDHLRAALLYLTYGHMAFELLAEVDSDGRARLVSLAERMPHTIGQIHSDPKTGVFLGITQDLVGYKDLPQIPADRLAFYCHEKEGSWAGTSLLRPSWAPFVLKQELQRVNATGIRRFAMGVPNVKWATGTNPTPQQVAQAQQFASAARAGETAGGSLPPGATLELTGLTGGVPNALETIKFLNSEMAIAALMPHMDLGTSETGSRAVASTFVDSWLLALGSIAEEIADVATRQIAARIVGWNWSDEPVPRIVASGIGAQRDVTAESLQLLLSSGALSADPGLEAWVRREYRLPERADQPEPKPVTSGVDLPPPPANRSPARARAARRKAPGQMALFNAAEDDPEPAPAVIQQQWEQAKTDLLEQWPEAAQPMVDELATQAEAAAEDGDLSLLGELAVSAGVLAAIALLIGDSGSDVAKDAAANVVAEASRQGVDIDMPDVTGEGRVRQTADTIAALIASGYASGAARAALQLAGADPQSVRDAVAAHLGELGTSSTGLVGDNVGALLTAAQNAGRMAVLEQHPASRYRAVEVNDKNRCGPCKDIADTEFTSLADAVKAYPATGYAACEGLSRCRGYLHPIF